MSQDPKQAPLPPVTPSQPTPAAPPQPDSTQADPAPPPPPPPPPPFDPSRSTLVSLSLSLVFFGFLISLFTIISDSISFRFVSTHGINLDFGDLSFGFQFWIFLWVLVLFYVECGTQILTHEFSFYAIV